MLRPSGHNNFPVGVGSSPDYAGLGHVYLRSRAYQPVGLQPQPLQILDGKGAWRWRRRAAEGMVTDGMVSNGTLPEGGGPGVDVTGRDVTDGVVTEDPGTAGVTASGLKAEGARPMVGETAPERERDQRSVR